MEKPPEANAQLQPRSRSSASTSPQQAAWIAERLTAAELSKPGPELDQFTKALLFRLWLQTLAEIGEEAFDAAFQTVMNASTFRPDIAEIRRAAGVNRGIVDPVEQEALSELRKVFEALRKHGPKLRPIPGEILNDGRDERGLILAVPQRAPATPPPALSAATEEAIEEMGYGDRQAGLQALMAHLAMTGTQDANSEFYTRDARWIEKRWVMAYRRART